MFASLNNCALNDTSSIARACAITFKGDASKEVYKEIFE